MKNLLFFLIALPLAAQQPAAAPAAQETKPAAPEEAKKEEAKAEQPSPAAEQWLTGSVDFGYRWVGGIGGDFNTYRSVVNLGEGPKLFGLDLTLQPPKRHWVDRIDIRANSWGGEPYNTARIEARKEGAYRFTWDYRNIAYYNFLPSFADPTRDLGLYIDQRGFDTFRRSSDFELELHPGHRIVPYVAYSRNGGRGRGTTNLVLQANEYTVPNRLDDHTNEYRGGLRFEFNRFHATVEQGAFNFSDAQETSFGPAQNFGNRTTPLLGNTLFLTTGRQAYGARVDGIFSKALVTASPASWLNLYGQFLFSQAKSTNHFTQTANGNFLNLSTLALYTGQTLLLDSLAKQPHPSGSFAAEVRPLHRLRILESVITDRLHNASSALLIDQLLSSGTPLTPDNLLSANELVLNYNQQEVNAIFDVTSKLSIRAGHRYVWGDASAPAAFVLNVTRGLTSEQGELRRQVGLAGVTFRTAQKLRITLDYEGSPGDRAYFRTSLNEYQKGRVQASYQVMPSLQLAAHFLVLKNHTPDGYDFLNRNNSVSAYWTPWGGKRFNLLAEYSRSTLRSDIAFVIPNLQIGGQFATDLSRYRENAHTGTAMVDIPLPGKAAVQPKLSFGGSFFTSSGSRPTQYYQPVGRIVLPITKHVEWNAEWRWYGLSQPFYLFEGFRSHQFITGFKLAM